MRAFMTTAFARAARKAEITPSELWRAVRDAQGGRAVALGGGVLKKRLNRNRHRGIILARGGKRCFFVFLFAKQDQANINAAELDAFRLLAKNYASLTDEQLLELLSAKDLWEICRDPA